MSTEEDKEIALDSLDQGFTTLGSLYKVLFIWEEMKFSDEQINQQKLAIERFEEILRREIRIITATA